MSGLIKVGNALLSVYYKEDVVAMAYALKRAGVKLYSSGGTADAFRDAGLDVTGVSDLTRFPSLFDGRVKTLHPKVHGGILYRRDNPDDVAEARNHDIPSFDLVVVNFYPVHEALQKTDVTIGDVVKLTDVGGPTMVNSAAKNHKFVGVVVDPKDYMPVAREIAEQGGLTLERRQQLATKAFRTTADYYNSIAKFYESLR